MKADQILWLFILLPLLGASQASTDNLGLSWTPSVDVSDIFIIEPKEVILRTEIKKDSLFVYKKVTPAYNGVSCAVYHPDGVCSWYEPYNVRDVYVVENGEIVFVVEQRPEYIKKEKTTYEYIEKWD